MPGKGANLDIFFFIGVVRLGRLPDWSQLVALFAEWPTTIRKARTMLRRSGADFVKSAWILSATWWSTIDGLVSTPIERAFCRANSLRCAHR